ncbi:putative MFS transporter [Penicillium brasilianum]|uniref:Putative MFS transporter n=1 Tax=Penicillium brasilianum TaxID=104259 RepID=A0A1S9RRB7_PENBI|nr:putative MFS transporter [Penicillium brasilianum]
MLGNMFAAGITPLFGLIIKDLGVSTVKVSKLSSYAVLALGLSNVFAVVASKYIGKRYTILASLAVFTATNVWTVYTTTFDSLLATRFVGGLCGGVIEALGPEMIVETFHEKRLASAMVVYVAFMAAGSALGPVLAGLIGTGTGNWQWYFTLLAVISGVIMLLCILMLPETTTSSLSVGYCDQSEVPACKHDAEIAEHSEVIPNTQQEVVLWDVWVSRSFKVRNSDWDRDQNAFQYLYMPFLMLSQPAVLVTTIVFGLTIGWTVACSIVFSNVFQAPPMSWSARAVGFFNIAPLAGLIAGLPIGGILADHLSTRSAKRHLGIHIPESRLLLVTIGGVLSPAGVLIIGLTMSHNTHWIGPAIGWGLLSLGLTASANILLTYAVDAYPYKAAHTALLVNVIKNLLAFGVSFQSMDWYLRDGPLKQFGAMAGALWASYLLVVPLYFFGAKIRARFQS